MSQAPAGRAAPRWSVDLHVAGSAVLIAGLLRDRACVAVLPLPVLTWSGPMSGSVFGLSPVALNAHVASSERL